ncbi:MULTISPECIES: class I SAM-dependent methyltransferase [unclassified Saccharothrix]|uniref:class I SAM-dependent methyltransferase n=1 Tax=unclassified Saccharothrix TaxID=2593673 RepID=UPI00307DA4E7
MARTPRLAAGRARALGLPTRGTTNPNRLRRVDRWVAHACGPLLERSDDPLVVDLGYGSSPITTVELATRLRHLNPRLRVLGLELDAERVAAGEAVADPPRLEFRRGGFELAGRRPVLLRAFNVLRQYTEEQAAEAWDTMVGRLAPGGVLVEGTCDEIGRRCSWVALTADGPQTFTLSCLPRDIDTPGDLAERLPKALIHRNVPGERVHALLTELDACWATAATYAPFGPRARWVEAVRLFSAKWPVLDDRKRWRLGEVTVPWHSVQP